MAFGTPALYRPAVLREKLDLLARWQIPVYPGGTFLEVAVLQGQGQVFLVRARDVGFTVIEVSDGTIHMDAGTRRGLVAGARELGLRVITEVGKKDAAAQPSTPELIAQARADLDAGAEYVVVEARESGRGIGIYDASGRLKADELDALAAALPAERLIWEAPDKAQQQALIARFGPNVSLGNVAPAEVLALEALRTGLRADTLRLAAAALPALAGAEGQETPAAGG